MNINMYMDEFELATPIEQLKFYVSIVLALFSTNIFCLNLSAGWERIWPLILIEAAILYHFVRRTVIYNGWCRASEFVNEFRTLSPAQRKMLIAHLRNGENKSNE